MSRKFLGVLTPSSNTILEPATSALISPLPHVTAHFSRLSVTRISLSADSDDQFGFSLMLSAARLLADARVGVIAWSGTSASWLGNAWDLAFCDAVAKETGIATYTAVGAITELLTRISARRIGLVSPYTDDVQDRIIENYGKAGVEVCAERHSRLSENFAFSEVTDLEVSNMCREVAKNRPDAIVIMCTNMRGWSIMADLEDELGIPVIDSTSAVVWKGLALLNTDATPLAARGAMFRL